VESLSQPTSSPIYLLLLLVMHWKENTRILRRKEAGEEGVMEEKPGDIAACGLSL